MPLDPAHAPFTTAKKKDTQNQPLLITLGVLGGMILLLTIANIAVPFLPKSTKQEVANAGANQDSSNSLDSKLNKTPLADLDKKAALRAAIEMFEPDYRPPVGFADSSLKLDDPAQSYTLGYSYLDNDDIIDANYPTYVYSDYDFDVDHIGKTFATIKVLNDDGKPDSEYYVRIAFPVDSLLYEMPQAEKDEISEYNETDNYKEPDPLPESSKQKTIDRAPGVYDESEFEELDIDEETGLIVDHTEEEVEEPEEVPEPVTRRIPKRTEETADLDESKLAFIDTSNDFIEKALPLVYMAYRGSNWHTIYDYEFKEYADAVTLTTYEIELSVNSDTAADSGEKSSNDSDNGDSGSSDSAAKATNSKYSMNLYKVNCTVSKETGKLEIEQNKNGEIKQMIHSYPLTEEEVDAIDETYADYFSHK